MLINEKIQIVVRIESKIYCKKTKAEAPNARYYISSLPADARLLNESIRSHWAIENNLHWNLDVIFKQDNQAKRNQRTIENSNLIVKLAITMLDNETTIKKSKNRKRLKAFADNSYRELIMKV